MITDEWEGYDVKFSRTVVWTVVNGNDRHVTAELHWTTTDPYAIEVIFHELYGPVKWQFAREILAAALVLGWSGEAHGDVSAIRGGENVGVSGRTILTESNHGNMLWLFLSSPDGTVCMSAEASEIEAFLRPTTEMVPIGHEGERYAETLDATIAKLLG